MNEEKEWSEPKKQHVSSTMSGGNQMTSIHSKYFVDQRPQSTEHAKLASQIDGGARMIAQRAVLRGLLRSPRMEHRSVPVVQAVLNINHVQHEAEVSEEEVANADTRTLLNEWRVADDTHSFDSIADAEQTATYLAIMARSNAVIAGLTAKYIDENWRAIETLCRDLTAMLNNEMFTGVSGDLYEKKWELVDAVNAVAAENDAREMDNGLFKEKRAEVVKAYFNAPAIPEVGADNLATRVAASMDSDERVGNLRWVQGNTADNAFRQWIADDAVELDNNATMNCWEAIFYSAYRAGLMTRAAIVALYNNVKREGDFLLDDIETAMGPQCSLFDVIEGGGLQRGDIILTTGNVADHVAMSMGGDDALSL